MELCDKNIKNMHKFLYSFTPMWCRVLQFDVFLLFRFENCLTKKYLKQIRTN